MTDGISTNDRLEREALREKGRCSNEQLLSPQTLISKINSGSGWRLGWQPTALVFRGLVGSDRWAIELTEQELRDFCTLVLQLIETINQMQSELADEENLECSATTENLTVEVTGYPPNLSLYLQLTTGRRAEGSWAVVPGFVTAIRDLTSMLFPTESSSRS